MANNIALRGLKLNSSFESFETVCFRGEIALKAVLEVSSSELLSVKSFQLESFKLKRSLLIRNLWVLVSSELERP